MNCSKYVPLLSEILILSAFVLKKVVDIFSKKHENNESEIDDKKNENEKEDNNN